MIVRAYKDGDAEKIAAIHEAQGLDYHMIDLTSPLVVAKNICEDNGEVIAATALKIQAETYLWMSPHCDPRVKWDAIRLMQRDIVRQAMRLGLEQLVSYVPECVGKFFAKRMKSLKWNRPRDGWTPWVYEVKP